MYMDYQSYKSCCFNIPVFCMIAFSSVALFFGVRLVYMAWSKKWDWRKSGFYLLMIMGYGVVACIQIGILYNGGGELRFEKENDAVEMQGEIINIKGLNTFSFPIIHGDYEYEEYHGYEFTINGVQCKFVVKGSLEAGDYVTVKYLPKSGYILYIAEIDRNAVNIE